MYLWRVNDLARDLKADSVSETEQLKYLFVLLVISIVVADPYIWTSLEYTIWDSITSVIMLVLTIGGTYYCFRKNHAGDNKCFIVRYICLAIPILVRLLAVALPIALTLVAIETYLGIGAEVSDSGEELYMTTPYEVLLVGVFEFIFYLYLATKIGEVSAEAGNLSKANL